MFYECIALVNKLYSILSHSGGSHASMPKRLKTARDPNIWFIDRNRSQTFLRIFTYTDYGLF